MESPTRRYAITAYSEWETLDVESECPDDQNAVDKARRYGTLKYVGKNFPAVIFAHISCEQEDGVRDVGTWEYRIRHVRKPTLIWHAGSWSKRPMPEDRLAIRRFAEEFADGS